MDKLIKDKYGRLFGQSHLFKERRSSQNRQIEELIYKGPSPNPYIIPGTNNS